MNVYYNNGETDKVIKSVSRYRVIAGSIPVVELELPESRKMRLRLDNVVEITEDSIADARRRSGNGR